MKLVLTLLILEFGFGEHKQELKLHANVLTLLILEFGFGVTYTARVKTLSFGLNPSYTGIWLRGDYCCGNPDFKGSLNPSYTGIWLRGCFKTFCWFLCGFVLTLLILEFGFGVIVGRVSQV